MTDATGQPVPRCWDDDPGCNCGGYGPAATGQPDGDQLREALVATVLEIEPDSRQYPDRIARALLPVIREHTERIAAARAADELYAAAVETNGWAENALRFRSIAANQVEVAASTARAAAYAATQRRLERRATALRAAHSATERTD